jgi:hypothetical protein
MKNTNEFSGVTSTPFLKSETSNSKNDKKTVFESKKSSGSSLLNTDEFPMKNY